MLQEQQIEQEELVQSQKAKEDLSKYKMGCLTIDRQLMELRNRQSKLQQQVTVPTGAYKRVQYLQQQILETSEDSAELREIISQSKNQIAMLGEDILAFKVQGADLVAHREELEHLQSQIVGFSREFQVFISGDQASYEEIVLQNFLLDTVKCLRVRVEDSPRDYAKLTREI